MPLAEIWLVVNGGLCFGITLVQLPRGAVLENKIVVAEWVHV